MKIAVFGRKFDKNFEAGLQIFFDKICRHNAEIHIYEPFLKFLETIPAFKICTPEIFTTHAQITSDFDFFFSLGGDGTFLDAVRYVRDSNIPIIGINTGKLGFLANIAQEEIEKSMEDIFAGNYHIEERSLIAFEASDNPFFDFPYGLNEITLQKSDNSLITIDTEIDGDFLNTYRTDGLIISTPTGSTAYSMSVGGPILAPDCNSIIISPIASHNLTVRPIVITNSYTLKLNVKSNSSKFLITIDSRSHEFSTNNPITIKIAGFKVNMVRLPNHTFYNTIRKKLMWGADIRN
jgi:NAD+ kinase